MPLEDGEWIDDTLDEQGLQLPTAEEADLGDQSPGPEGVEQDSALIDTEPQGSTQAEESPSAGTDIPDEQTDELPEFDPRVREDFEGLMYLGRLTDEFHWFGHHFVIRTLTTGELIEVGLLHKQYANSLADVKAYQALVVAACVVSVDGKSLPIPISNDKTDTELINKFEYVRERWYPPTLDAVYERLLLLEARVDEVIEAMAKAHGWAGSTRTLSESAV